MIEKVNLFFDKNEEYDERYNVKRADEYGLKYKYLPRGADWHEPIKHTCRVPYFVVTVSMTGHCYLCECDGHLPLSVGHVTEFDSIESIFSCQRAKELQKTVDQKTYDYCSITHCGILFEDHLPISYSIIFNIDDSCNLACPTCRSKIINHTSGRIYEEKKSWIEHLSVLINKFQHKLLVRMSGNGDPLASLPMRSLISNWKHHPMHSVAIQTNGLLLEKVLSGKELLNDVTRFSVSIDAGTAEVYEVVRKPGKFPVLLKNLDWLKNYRDTCGREIEVELNFVLSSLNSHDVLNFAELCSKYQFVGRITKVENWLTFGENGKDHAKVAVLDSDAHPLYQKTIEDLRTIRDTNDLVIMQHPIPSLL